MMYDAEDFPVTPEPAIESGLGPFTMNEIAEHCASLPVLDSRRVEEILGYDESGLPS